MDRQNNGQNTLSEPKHWADDNIGIQINGALYTFNKKCTRNYKDDPKKDNRIPTNISIQEVMRCSQLRREGWNLINWFNSATILYLSQARTWISNVICHGLFVFSKFS